MSGLPIIKSYSFGKMTVADQSFSNDLIILPDGTILDNWFRQQGHFLIRPDITRLIAAAPDHIVIGTGAYGRMQVDRKLAADLEGKGIQVYTASSDKAMDIYNDLIQKEVSIGACFHLTC